MKSDQAVEESLVNLLRNLPPQVADRLRDKYEADRAAFIAFTEEILPSKDPKYWASSSCNQCHGRGIIGRLVSSPNQDQLVCKCTEKSYKAWLVKARKMFNERGGHEK